MMMMNEAIVDNDRDSFENPIPERRQCARRPTERVRARLAWRSHGFRVSKTPAQLLDISESGARVSINSATPPGLSFFWVGLESLPGEWVKATIQETVPHDLGWICRFRFAEQCPPGIIERARTRKTLSHNQYTILTPQLNGESCI
jgi:hypothetical protein